ncbi:alpha/beta fold hydrolase [Deinococcus pimensis]|uniref:alpha/beta fold hydrolase n=1 Tax=Deinococcus pimensis TaxID=309888 RepID=UPI00047FBAA2|nr:alpha/beta hydrolase [Deinococcus pimensis]
MTDHHLDRPIRLRRQPTLAFAQVARAATRVASVAALVGTTALAGGGAPNATEKFPPTGQLVDVGGYRLHLDCRGSGDTTVVLEAGNGANSLYWALVQPELAKTTRVCAYDRAGYGWSDVSPKPRTTSVLVNELHTLLRAGKVPGPYVLVGHSLGGVIVRQYAYRYPRDVKALVLVDSATEGQKDRFPAEYNKIEDPKVILGFLAQLRKTIESGEAARNPDAVMPLDTRLPAPAAEAFRTLLLSDSKQIVAAGQEYQATLSERWKPLRRLGDLKLVVVRRDPSVNVAATPPNVSKDVATQFEQAWADLQGELAALSSHATLVMAERSGHNIQVERPDVVIKAVRDALGK